MLVIVVIVIITVVLLISIDRQQPTNDEWPKLNAAEDRFLNRFLTASISEQPEALTQTEV